MDILPAILLGVAGSLHCVAMCGPLLLALPVESTIKRAALQQMLPYHSGRILTYAGLGMLFGLFGKGIAVAGFQQLLSIISGIFMIGMALMAWRFEYWITALPGFSKFTKKVQQAMGGLLRQQPHGKDFLIGSLNGLLPCGMVYVALAGSMATAGPWEGAIFMASFGLGTLPMLLSLSLFGQSVKGLVRQKIKLVQPVLLIFAGCLLIQRGLHIDLSFLETATPKATLQCH